jgi:Ca2+-binding EF-hand superfamily protein
MMMNALIDMRKII